MRRLLALSGAVCAMHFGGLEYGVYTAVWWWDLATHSLSGLGVAWWLSVLGVPPRRLVPAVLAIACGFEVYEYVFKDFYHGWTTSYYAWDTAVDLVMGAAGARAFVLFFSQ
jgi:hypothetical protein